MKFGILGAGSWGTALAILWSRHGHQVEVWARDAKHARRCQQDRENARYLKGQPFPEHCSVTNDLDTVIQSNKLLCVALPLQAYRAFFNRVRPALRADHQLVLLSKGIELDSLLLPSQIITDTLGDSFESRTYALSGPSFAKEVAEDRPTAVVLAGPHSQELIELQKVLNCPTFRTYRNQDLLGVEIGGALKNVIAIAAGIVRGLALGHNTMAGLITRGLSEIARLGVTLGARRQTFAGLSGMGDLVLTCNGDLSRNLRVGMGLAEGKTLTQILDELGMVAEGVKTSQAAHNLAHRHNIEMPITSCVYQILYENLDPMTALHQLMTRSLKSEIEPSIFED